MMKWIVHLLLLLAPLFGASLLNLVDASFVATHEGSGLINTHLTVPDLDSDGMPDNIDNCQGIANAAQENDVHPETPSGDHCEDPDIDSLPDALEGSCGSSPDDAGSAPERIDGAFEGADEDLDGMTDEPLPQGSSTYDCDGDGWIGLHEMRIYVTNTASNDQDPCGSDGWPVDLADNDNTLNIGDINSFLFPNRSVINPPVDAHSPFNKFNHPLDDWGTGGPSGGMPPDGIIDAEMARWNLQTPPHLATTLINIGDLNSLITGAVGSPARPPMFGGQQAFFTNGGQCPWPP